MSTRDNDSLSGHAVGHLNLPVNAFAHRVRKISVEAEAEVFDLTVDHPSHSFIAEGLVVHNCWKEIHDGQTVVVVRKGSTPNAPGQRSFIGGSMGDDSVIVEGLDVPDNDTLLRSTVHGAGRIMSRSQAAGSRYGAKKKPGLITRQMMSEWTKGKGVIVRGGGTDESPHVYRRLPDVLALHASTIRIVHTLRPIGVAMAGANEIDPYKD